MSIEPIRIMGAGENNLQNVSLALPKNQLTVFAGVSGSGKSSLVFDTIAVEAQRQLGEFFPLYVRSRMARYEPPKVERLENLTAAVVIDQRPMVGNSRSTVGTFIDAAPLLRLLFSRCGVPSAGPSSAYSFNDPAGMCPTCGGLGRKVTLLLEKFLDREKSLNDGAIRFPIFTVGSWQWQTYANSGLFDCDKPLRDYTAEEWELLLHGKGLTVKIGNSAAAAGYSNLKYEGLIDRFERLYLNRDLSTLSARNREIVLEYIGEGDCPDCHGARLSRGALESLVLGQNIAALSDMEIPDLIEVLKGMEEPVGRAIVGKLLPILTRVVEMGLGYLSLGRTTDTLSGGEAQRLRMVRHLGGSLVGLTYIFDEPTVGLHPRDVGRLCRMLLALRERGNTLLVVEHDTDVMAMADHLVEMGPGAGSLGGRVIFEGDYRSLLGADTPTGRCLRKPLTLGEHPITPVEWYPLEKVTLHNLKNLSVAFPKGCLTAVTGVAGSGKSSLVSGAFHGAYPQAVLVDQSPIGTSSRSTPASYLGIFDEIRSLFAKANGVSAGLFSFNSAGACPVCGGKGEVSPDMAFMDPVSTRCEACGGTRYSPEALSYKLRGRTILEVLGMTGEEALAFFPEKKIAPALGALCRVGMGYLTLGQSTASLSGGECQRLKLATQLQKKGGIYLLDEPTTGLHPVDVEGLILLLRGLVEEGNTVIVVEHNLEVVAKADWVIDLGPEGGKDGGRLLFSGAPAGLLLVEESLTGEHLRRRLMGEKLPR